MSVLKKEQIHNYSEAVQYLYDIPRFTSKNLMENTKDFLRKLRNPSDNMRIIHIAGTNGKGSVCAYLRSILTEAGYTCGVFTSPHLVEARERYQINGEMVSEEVFFRAFMKVYDLINWEEEDKEKEYHPTFFEYLFFMGMIIFNEVKLDYCILETGLGGRLDATNAIERKDMSIITRIGYDHMEYLGNTLPEIAGEKAGIISKNVPVIYWDEETQVSRVIEDTARAKGSKTYSVSKRDYAFLNFENKSIDFSYHSRYYDYIRLCLHTIAFYQMENASLAIRAVEVLDKGKNISKEHIVNGVSKAFWAGRMEEIEPDIFVDGAHNADGIRAFLETIQQDGWKGKRHLLFGVVKDKDYKNMTKAIGESNLFEKISLVQIQNARTTNLKELEKTFLPYVKSEIEVYNTAKEAYKQIKGKRAADERIYIAGSLYLVGEIKEALERCRHD